MKVSLIEITAYDPVAAASVTIRACTVDDVAACLLNNAVWWPIVSRAPRRNLDLFDGAFTGDVSTGAGDLELSLAGLIVAGHPNAGRYVFAGRKVRTWRGELGAPFAAYSLKFDGLGGTAKLSNGRLALPLKVDADWLDRMVPPSTYFGTGGIEGPPALKGATKPLCLGRPRFVEGVLIDATNSVFQVSGYGAIHGIPAAFDRLVRYPAAIADCATFAELVAAVVPAGQWMTCLAFGLARFGAPPSGPATFHVEGDAVAGWVSTAGAIIGRLASLAGATPAQISAANLAALDAAVPYPMSLALGAQTSAGDVIQQIAASCNGAAGVDWLGKLFVTRVGIGVPALTLRSDGTALPPVQSVSLLEVGAPFWQVKMTAARTNRVHQAGDYGAYEWADVVGAGKPVSYRVRCAGFNTIIANPNMPGGNTHMGLWNEDTQTQVSPLRQMYVVADYDAATDTWASTYYDTLGNPLVPGGGGARDQDVMQFRLQTIPDGRPVIVFSYDEPQGGRLGSSIPPAMYRCGASRAVFGGASFPYRGAYCLIGVAGAGEGNGAEYLAGVGDTTPGGPLHAFIDVTFTLTNGVLAIAGKTISQAQDLVFADGVTIEADRTAQAALIGSALSSAAYAQAVADGKIDTFYQPSPPAGSEGDLWFDTDDGYRQYRFSGSSWSLVSDTRIGIAISNAAGAQATADGKVTTFTGEATPVASGVGDLWYKPSTKALTRWSGSTWTAVSAIGVEDGATYGATSAQNVAIVSANAAANSALSTLSFIADDGYLDAGEKPTVLQQYNTAKDGSGPLAAQGGAFQLGEAATFVAASTALDNYVSGLALTSATVTAIPGGRATMLGKFSDFWAARINLQTAIAAYTATHATWAGIPGDIPSGVAVAGTGKTLAEITAVAFSGGGGASPPVAIPFGISSASNVNGPGSVTVQFNGIYGGAGTGNLTLAVQMQVGAGGFATVSGGTFVFSGLNGGDSVSLPQSVVAFDTGGPMGAVRCLLTATGSHTFSPVPGDCFYYVG